MQCSVVRAVRRSRVIHSTPHAIPECAYVLRDIPTRTEIQPEAIAPQVSKMLKKSDFGECLNFAFLLNKSAISRIIQQGGKLTRIETPSSDTQG